jgi:hypothetical protein
MEKLYSLIIIFLIFSNSSKSNIYAIDEDIIEYSWEMKEYDVEMYSGENILSFVPLNVISYERPLVSVKVEYRISNLSNDNIWLYDFQNGNLWQTHKTITNDNIIENKYLIYEKQKGLIICTNNAPRSIIIPPKDSICGIFTMEYYVEYECNDWINIDTQIFNFYILSKDITTENYYDEQLVKNISENYSKEYFVELPLKIKWIE